MAKTAGSIAAPPAADEPAEREEDQSVTELVEQLGHDVSALVLCEAQLEASRHMPELRRAARDIAAALVAGIAFLTAFAFANVAALQALSNVMADWLAALVLAAVWIVVGVALVLLLMVRAGHVTGWKWWWVLRAGPKESLADLEQARDGAAQTVRDSLGRLAPALAIEIATASIGIAGDVAGEVANDLVDVGQDFLEDSDDMVESITDDLPGGGVVNLMWDVVLLPGRVGLKVAATVLKRAEPGN